MKKVILSLIAVLLILNSLYSQSPQNKIEKFYKQTKHSIQIINNNLYNDLKFDLIGKICVENWDVDSLGNLNKTSDGLITMESLSGGKYLMTQEADFLFDSIPTHITTKAYLNSLIEYGNDNTIDSLIVYLTQNGVKSIFSKQINDFENGNIIKSTSYVDYTIFGLPTGLIQSGYTNYYYDNKDFLISETTYTSSFWDGTTSVSDSIFYTNNSKGYPTESLHFVADNEKILQQTEKHTYKYDSDDRLIKEEIYLIPDDWTLSKRTVTTIKPKFSVNLTEKTTDKGTTWTPSSRDSTYFTKNLPFEYPNRTTYELYENDTWKLQSVTINKNCSGTYTENIDDLDFIAGFNNNDIYIKSDQIINNASVSLYNVNGQQVFYKKYEIIPERILTNNLKTGIYILKINGQNHKGIRKLIKF